MKALYNKKASIIIFCFLLLLTFILSVDKLNRRLIGSNTSGMPAETCLNKDYYICLDFEESIPENFSHQFDVGKNIKIVKNEEAYQSKGALYFSSKGTQAYHQSYITKENIPGSHWGRIFYKIETPTPIADNHTVLHGTLVALRGANYEVRVVDTVQNNISKQHQYLYNVQIDNDAEGGVASDYNWHFSNEWVCVEWYIDHKSQSYEFFRNGSRIDQISHKVKFPSENSIPSIFTWIKFGLQTYQSNEGMSGWMDNIAVDSKRIGCGV